MWLEGNVSLFHRYSSVAEEIRHRVNARVAAYEKSLPDDVLHTLGPRPVGSEDSGSWRDALHAYAEARLVLGAKPDLSDTALLAGARWRDVADAHQQPASGETAPRPALRRAM